MPAFPRNGQTQNRNAFAVDKSTCADSNPKIEVHVRTTQIGTAVRKESSGRSLTIIWTESRKRLSPRVRSRWTPTQEPSMPEKNVPRFERHAGRRGQKAWQKAWPKKSWMIWIVALSEKAHKVRLCLKLHELSAGRSRSRPSQSGSPAVLRVRQLSLSKLVTDKNKNISVSGIGELCVFAADCSQSLYQGENRLGWSDGPRLLEAGGEERVDALKDRIFPAQEFQHPRSSLPCWISLLLRCGLRMCSWKLPVAIRQRFSPQHYNTNTAARQVADSLIEGRRIQLLRGHSIAHSRYAHWIHSTGWFCAGDL